MLHRLVAVLLVVLAGASSPARADLVDDLLARMTLEEKVGQLSLVTYGSDYDPELVRRGEVGGVLNFTAATVGPVRRLARESRLGIPALTSLDVVHGYRVMFPVPLGEAATFNTALVRRTAEWGAREAAAAGIDWTFSPMVDVSRDVRWGRIVEGSGEDVFLATALARARTEGIRAGGLAATTKHFAGYGASVAGRDYDSVSIGPAEFHDRHLPPFRAALDAGAETVMAAFIARDGVPAVADRSLLTDLLRGQWGFTGVVVSDFAAIAELINHGVAADGAEAARRAFLAGVDVEMASPLYRTYLAAEVRAGRVPIAAVDAAVRRVLAFKVRLGLFTKPDPDPSQAEPDTLGPEARALSREAARESLVLLQNRGDVLPLAPGIRKLAVVGPFAADPYHQIGPHDAKSRLEEAVTILDGVKRRAGQVGVEVVHAPGCEAPCDDASGFSAAVEAASDADAVVAVLGEPRHYSGEGGTRAHLDLPGRQEELLRRLAATGRPVIVVLFAGRPLELKAVTEQAAAVVMAWYPGTEGGPAVAEVLFGDESPSGRLPHTWPRTIGQVPIYYDHLPSGRPSKPGERFVRNYIDEAIEPLYPFGFGLGYGRFVYSDLAVPTPEVTASDVAEVQVTLTNVGPRTAKEVAQLYVHAPGGARSRPVRELKGFQKVELAPGEARRLTFRLPVSELAFHEADGSAVVEPGPVQVWVGSDATASLTGQARIVARAP